MYVCGGDVGWVPGCLPGPRGRSWGRFGAGSLDGSWGGHQGRSKPPGRVLGGPGYVLVWVPFYFPVGLGMGPG